MATQCAKCGVYIEGEDEIHCDECKAELAAAPLAAPEKRLEIIRSVIEKKQYRYVDGQLLDLTTAHMLMVVYDALSTEMQSRFVALPIKTMVEVGWRYIK